MKSGYIPEEVNYHCRGRQIDTFDLNGVGKEESVIPAFCCDSTNPKTNETAKKWAAVNRVWNEKSRQWEKCAHVENIVTRKNIPIDGKTIRIIGIDQRGNGGRAYKVLIDDTYYFDMREDVILDTIFKYGINKNGILNGKFLWGMNGSQMKLILEGSELHKELIRATEVKKKSTSFKKIKASELIIGGIYTTATQRSFHAYIGKALKHHIFLRVCKGNHGCDEWDMYTHYIHRTKSPNYKIMVDQLDKKTINTFICNSYREYTNHLEYRHLGFKKAEESRYAWPWNTAVTKFEDDPWVIDARESIDILQNLQENINI